MSMIQGQMANSESERSKDSTPEMRLRSGSNKSRRSLAGISIFQDQTAGYLLAGEEEMSFSMDQVTSEGLDVTPFTRPGQKVHSEYERSQSVRDYIIGSEGNKVFAKDISIEEESVSPSGTVNAVSKRSSVVKKGDDGKITTTMTKIVTNGQKQESVNNNVSRSSSISSNLTDSKGGNVKKRGSFQMKSSFSGREVERTPSSASRKSSFSQLENRPISRTSSNASKISISKQSSATENRDFTLQNKATNIQMDSDNSLSSQEINIQRNTKTSVTTTVTKTVIESKSSTAVNGNISSSTISASTKTNNTSNASMAIKSDNISNVANAQPSGPSVKKTLEVKPGGQRAPGSFSMGFKEGPQVKQSDKSTPMQLNISKHNDGFSQQTKTKVDVKSLPVIGKKAEVGSLKQSSPTKTFEIQQAQQSYTSNTKPVSTAKTIEIQQAHKSEVSSSKQISTTKTAENQQFQIPRQESVSSNMSTITSSTFTRVSSDASLASTIVKTNLATENVKSTVKSTEKATTSSMQTSESFNAKNSMEVEVTSAAKSESPKTPGTPKTPSTPSVLQNKDFKDKMTALFGGSPSSSKPPTPVHASTLPKNKPNVEKLDLSKSKGDFTYSSTETSYSTFPRSSHTDREDKDDTPVPSGPLMSPIQEMQQTIKSGVVSTLAKDTFKHLKLTGGMVNPNTLEKKPKAPSTLTETNEDGSPKKKYKFEVEGIDTPATEESKQDNLNNRAPTSPIKRPPMPFLAALKTAQISDDEAEEPMDTVSPLSPFSDDTTQESGDVVMRDQKSKVAKRGFSYVLDAKLASAIVQKATDVQARRPHEAVEVTTEEKKKRESTSENTELVEAKTKLAKRDSHPVYEELKKEKEEEEIYKEARSKLRHDDSLDRRINDEVTQEQRQTHNLLLRDIRARGGQDSTEEESKSSHQLLFRDIRARSGQDKTEKESNSSHQLLFRDIRARGGNETTQEKGNTSVISTRNENSKQENEPSGTSVPQTSISITTVKLDTSDNSRKNISYEKENDNIQNSSMVDKTSVLQTKSNSTTYSYSSSIERKTEKKSQIIDKEQQKENIAPEVVVFKSDIEKPKSNTTIYSSSLERKSDKTVPLGNNADQNRAIPSKDDNQDMNAQTKNNLTVYNSSMERNVDKSLSIGNMSDKNRTTPMNEIDQSTERMDATSTENTLKPITAERRTISQQDIINAALSSFENRSSKNRNSSSDNSTIQSFTKEPDNAHRSSSSNSSGLNINYTQEADHSNKPFNSYSEEVHSGEKERYHDSSSDASDLRYAGAIDRTDGVVNRKSIAKSNTDSTQSKFIVVTNVDNKSEISDTGTSRALGDDFEINITGANTKVVDSFSSEDIPIAYSSNNSAPPSRSGKLNISINDNYDTNSTGFSSDEDYFDQDYTPQVYNHEKPSKQGLQTGDLHIGISGGSERVYETKGTLELVTRSPIHARQMRPPSPARSAHSATSHHTFIGEDKFRVYVNPLKRQNKPQNPHGAYLANGRPVSRAGSSIGSVHSSRAYSQRNERNPTMTHNISNYSSSGVNLKPLQVDVKNNHPTYNSLQTHPSALSPGHSSVSSPLTPGAFVTTHMNATSTLRHNESSHRQDYTSAPRSPYNNTYAAPAMGVDTRDVNMNTATTPQYVNPERVIRKGTRVPLRTSNPPSESEYHVSHIRMTDNGVSLDTVDNTPRKYESRKVLNSGVINGSDPMDMHPDVQYRKQKFYSVHKEGGVKSPKQLPRIGPLLEQTNKEGDKYNVTLKLNASAMSPGGDTRTTEHLEEYEEQILRGQRPRNSSSDRMITTAYNSTSTAPVHGNTPHGNTPIRGPHIARAEVMETSTLDYPVEHIRLTQYATDPSSQVREERFYMKSAVPVDENANIAPAPQQYNNAPGKIQNGGPEPRFTMCIDQTMTMDYVPKEQQPQKRQQPVNEAPIQRRNWPVEESSFSPRNAPVNENPYSPVNDPFVKSRRPKDNRAKKPRRPRNEVVEEHMLPSKHINPDRGMPANGYDDLVDYFSPDEDGGLENSPTPDFPNVVRGSFFIQNNMDTAGAPKVIDIVEESDSDGEGNYAVEDNVNMFQNDYLQRRENPLYSSDPDLSKRAAAEAKLSPTRADPKFTSIFTKSTKTTHAQSRESKPKSNPEFEKLERQDYNTEIHVNRSEYGAKSKKSRRSANGYDQQDGIYERMEKQQRAADAFASGRGLNSSSSHSKTTTHKFEVSGLLKDAPPDSIRQRIKVDREEEEILGPLPDDGNGPMLNFDTVSEKVDLGLSDGIAEVSVKVRCERIVPIRGVTDMFKKSSVIVTRLIEIDLTATEERRRLYEHILRQSSHSSSKNSKGTKFVGADGSQRHLSNKETFKLYKIFMGVAEADEQGKNESVQIDREVAEERRPDLQLNGVEYDDPLMDLEPEYDPDELDRRLEEQLIQYTRLRDPEPDAISYMSAVTETSDMIY